MRTAVVAFCLLLMIVGCAKQGAPGPEASGPDSAAPGSPVATTPPPSGSTAPPVSTVPPGGTSGPAPLESLLPVPAPLPEGLRQVALPAGQPVESTGLYFMDVATGKMDAWLPPVGEYNIPSISLSASDDERWILASVEKTGWLIRRSDGAAFRYDREKLHLTVGPGVILARPAEWQNGGAGGRCALLDDDVKLLSTFAVGGGCTHQHQVLFAPDGKQVALSDFDGALFVWLITAATGEVKTVGPLAAPEGSQISSDRITLRPGSGELVLEVWLTDPKEPGRSLGNLVRIYSWEGTLLTERRIPGFIAAFSPDGKLVSYNAIMGRLGQALVVEEWGAQQPRFRVAGGFGAQWLADSSGLLLSTFRGMKLASATGTLQAAPGRTDDSFYPFGWLLVSPNDANLFLTSATVIDRNGQPRREALLAEGKDLRIAQASWGPTAHSYHFTVMPPLGKGWDAEFWFWIGPAVQRPPYPEEYPLQVKDAAGECLNLRAEGAETAKVVRCLPTGTKLALILQENGEPMVHYEGQWNWLQVKTEQGEQGWVAVNTKSVSYTEN